MSNWAVTLWYKMNDALIGASHGRESLYISVAPAVGSALMHAKAPAKRTVEFLLEPLENLILYQREAAMQARQRQGSEEDPAEDVNNQLLPPPPICGLLQVKRIALLLDMYATSGLQYKHTAEVLAMLLTQVIDLHYALAEAAQALYMLCCCTIVCSTSHGLHLSTLIHCN